MNYILLFIIYFALTSILHRYANMSMFQIWSRKTLLMMYRKTLRSHRFLIRDWWRILFFVKSRKAPASRRMLYEAGSKSCIVKSKELTTYDKRYGQGSFLATELNKLSNPDHPMNQPVKVIPISEWAAKKRMSELNETGKIKPTPISIKEYEKYRTEHEDGSISYKIPSYHQKYMDIIEDPEVEKIVIKRSGPDWHQNNALMDAYWKVFCKENDIDPPPQVEFKPTDTPYKKWADDLNKSFPDHESCKKFVSENVEPNFNDKLSTPPPLAETFSGYKAYQWKYKDEIGKMTDYDWEFAEKRRREFKRKYSANPYQSALSIPAEQRTPFENWKASDPANTWWPWWLDEKSMKTIPEACIHEYEIEQPETQRKAFDAGLNSCNEEITKLINLLDEALSC